MGGGVIYVDVTSSLKTATISQQSRTAFDYRMLRSGHQPEIVPKESSHMGSKHRKQSQRAKRIALISAASATATCLTVGAAPPPPHYAVSSVPVALAASTGPDYTKLIESLSNSTNSALFAQGNFQNALAGLVNPLGAASGGLLPTLNAGTNQEDLTSLEGLLDTLAKLLAQPNLSNIPVLPADALPTILSALVPALAPVLGQVTPLLATLTTGLAGPLGTVEGVLTLINTLNDLPVVGGVIKGIPTLNDLLGLTVSETQYQSGYSWPILGIAGSTTVDNTFAQLPSLTVSGLVEKLTGSILTASGNPDIPVDVLGLPIPVPIPLSQLLDIVTGVLTPLDGISTPSITAWLPTASGNYGLPLGGSVAFLATMPTLDIGPLSVLNGLPIILPPGIDPATDTVVAIPLLAGGATLPLGLASFASVGTPGIVLPTATGINTVGGVSVTVFNLLGFPIFTNTNIQPANYYGTNGIDFSDGTNLATIAGLPIQYSLGSFNFGNEGFGFTGPSLFNVGLIPAFQVGTAPTQQSSDGLVGDDLLNTLLFSTPRALLPTRLTSLTQALGLPNPGDAATPFLNPLYASLVTPLATQYTTYLNQNIGSWTNGAANGLEQLTSAIADLSYGLPGAARPVVPPAGQSLQDASAQSVVTLSDDSPNIVQDRQIAVVNDKGTDDPITNVQNQAKKARAELDANIKAANAKTRASVKKAGADVEKSVKKTAATLNKIAEDGQDQIKKTVAVVQKSIHDAAKNVSDAAKNTADKKPAPAKTSNDE
jgi:hypothetical protein